MAAEEEGWAAVAAEAPKARAGRAKVAEGTEAMTAGPTGQAVYSVVPAGSAVTAATPVEVGMVMEVVAGEVAYAAERLAETAAAEETLEPEVRKVASAETVAVPVEAGMLEALAVAGKGTRLCKTSRSHPSIRWPPTLQKALHLSGDTY